MIFVDESFKELIKSNIHHFGLNINYFRFINDIHSTKEIQYHNGTIHCTRRRYPKISINIFSNIKSILGKDFTQELEIVNEIQRLCSKFQSLAVCGNYAEMIVSAKKVKLYVNYFTFKSEVHLLAYEIIAMQNKSRGYLEMKNHHKSIKAYTESEKMITKFEAEEVTMDGPGGDIVHRMLQQQSFLDTLIKKDMNYRKLHYKGPQNKIVPMKQSTYPFHMKSWKALKLRKGRDLEGTLIRFKRKRCILCHGIKANGRNRKCKQCRSASIFYCSRKCQKIHWKYVHRLECKEAAN